MIGPFNTDAEAVLLASLFQDNSAIDYAADRLAPESFALAAHQSIFGFMVRDYALGKNVNPFTLRSYFEDTETLIEVGGPNYLAQLGGISHLTPLPSLVREVADLADRRRMRAGLEVAANACADLETPLSEVVNHADAAVSHHEKDGIHQPTASEAIEELFDSYRDKMLGVKCGCIPTLDDLLGEMRPKQLVIGAGRPGMGKTALALSYGIGAAKRGHGVLYVSLEMSSTELAARMVADLCFENGDGVPYEAIRDGKMSEFQRGKAAAAHTRAKTLPFQIVDAGSLKMGRLGMLVRRHARKMEAAGFKLELVIIDYLQLTEPDGAGRSNYEAVSEVSRKLKSLAKENGLAVFALAQLSRAVENRPDKRPQLSDLRDSGQIEQDADAVLFLLRREYYLKQAEPKLGTAERVQWEQGMDEYEGVIEFILAKRRNGVAGQAKGEFHGRYQAVRG